MVRPIALLATCLLGAASSVAAPVKAPHLQVELVADVTSVQPGQDLSLGLHFVLDDGWHIYWRNPGDSGEPPGVAWTLPPGFHAGEIEWPVPERIDVGPLTDFGYSGSVLLPLNLRVPSDVAGSSVRFRAQVKWLVCNPDRCIPGSVPVSLTLPVDGEPRPSSAASVFAEADGRLPMPLPAKWGVTARASGDTLTLVVDGVREPFTRPPQFFPFGRQTIEHAAPQTATLAEDGFQLGLRSWRDATSAPRSIDGVLTVDGRAYTIAAPVVAPVVFQPFLLAFAGGLLLNLMPCVFPVLALKALSLVGLAGEQRRRMRLHGLLYGLGVVVSFWVLGGALLAARAGGAQLGWGFQLQSPVVIAMLASLFFWMALTLLGISMVGGSIMGVGSRLASGTGTRAAFFTGALATVVATPCTAPFMGTALGYAVTQPAGVALGVFTALGIGLALPYALLTSVPRVGTYLPRPGRWMETLEQLLAFPLLATVVWLVWVASLQAGPEAVVVILMALVLFGFAAWMVRQWPARWARVVAAVIVVVGLGIQSRLVPVNEPQTGGGALAWEPYSTKRLAELLETGRPIFVDFTAAWCVTCQVNERVALTTPEVTAKMRSVGVLPLRADWTRPNPDIARALEQFGRDGVPLYVLYSGRKEDPPRILPQILTPDVVLTELEQLEKGRRT